MHIALIVALILGGGLSVASEQALPDQTLYPIKVSVNERVRSSLTFNNESRARWEARQAERRLEEAQELSSRGRLAAESRAEVVSRFENHVKDFQNQVSRVESEGDLGVAFEIQSSFEAFLKAHEQILVRIAENEEGLREEINIILAKLRTALNSSIEARSELEAKIVASGAQFESAAQGKMRAAENKLSEVEQFIMKKENSGETELAVDAKVKLENAKELFAQGKAEVEVGNHGQAFATFQSVMTVAQEAKLIIAMENSMKAKLKIKTRNSGADMETKTESEFKIKGDTSIKNSDEDKSELKVESKVKSESKSNGEDKLKDESFIIIEKDSALKVNL